MIFKIDLLFLWMQFLLELNKAEEFDIKQILGVSGDCDFDCQGRLEDTMGKPQKYSPHPMERGFLGNTMRMAVGMVMPVAHFIYPKEHKVGFHLFNRSNFNRSEVVTVITKIKSRMFKNFKRNLKTKIIIHGWNTKVGYLITRYLRSAYLFIGDYNLIMVDWSSCSFWNYIYSKDQIPLIGRTVARFIDHLNKIYNLKPEDIHMIGHSLGAHIAGAAGHLVKTGKIGRITGLDPAHPMIDLSDTVNVLSTHSASFVDVIHSCSGWLGVKERIGHVDFFPNGMGWQQPGCTYDLDGSCSHRRSFGYFAESAILHDAFRAKHCPTWELYEGGNCFREPDVAMGEAVSLR